MSFKVRARKILPYPIAVRHESRHIYPRGYASLYRHIITRFPVFAINPGQAGETTRKRFIYGVLRCIPACAGSKVAFTRRRKMQYRHKERAGKIVCTIFVFIFEKDATRRVLWMFPAWP